MIILDNFPPFLQILFANVTNITRHLLSTGIFSATRLLQKNYYPRPTGWKTGKKFRAPARVGTHDLLGGKAISEVHLTPWSGDKVEFWQNL